AAIANPTVLVVNRWWHLSCVQQVRVSIAAAWMTAFQCGCHHHELTSRVVNRERTDRTVRHFHWNDECHDGPTALCRIGLAHKDGCPRWRDCLHGNGIVVVLAGAVMVEFHNDQWIVSFCCAIRFIHSATTFSASATLSRT